MKQATIFWFTGLSGAGKTTIADSVRNRLMEDGLSVLILDGDDVRKRLHTQLTFSQEDIKKNNELIVQLCVNDRREYDIIFVPIISPYKDSRKAARVTLGNDFYEIYFSANLETVADRDCKGLYAKAKCGEIDNLIGYSSGAPYEPPENPDCVIDTTLKTPKESIENFYQFVVQKTRKNENAAISKSNR